MPSQVHPPICNDLRAWCEGRPAASYQAVQPPRLATRQLPRTLEPEIDPSFYSLLSFAVPERALVAIPSARLVGPNCLVVLPDGSFAGELIALTQAGRQTMLDGEAAYTTPLPPPARRLDGQYHLLSVLGWTNYYHWNHDVIMRWQAYLDLLSPDTRYIVPGDLKAFHLDSLELLGIKEAQLVRFSGDEVWEVESLVVASPIYKTQSDVPEPLAWFRERSLAFFDISPAPANRRIYLGRNFQSDSHYRPVNAEAVESYLSQRGFETHYPHKLSFRQQAELFSRAEVIVGTGTGLANMVFAPPRAKILQIQEPSHTVHALWTMSEALGHVYWYFWGESVDNPGQYRPDIFIPIPKLAASLEAVLAQPGEAGA